DGARRAKYFGTFGVSVVASLGAAGLHILSPLTTTLNYGTFEPDGSLDVRVVYDHRVIDGANMARLMAEFEDALHGPILSELLAPRALPEITKSIDLTNSQSSPSTRTKILVASGMEDHQSVADSSGQRWTTSDNPSSSAKNAPSCVPSV